MIDDASNIYGHVEDANEMYAGSKFTILSVTVSLFHIKCLTKLWRMRLICYLIF